MTETPTTPSLPLPLRRKQAFQACWKPILANWIIPGAGYWMVGQKGRAKVFFTVYVVFTALAFLQLYYGPGAGPRGGVYVPQISPLAWLPTLGAMATLGSGPVYGVFAWLFGGVGTEPIRNLTQEYGATYIMVAGLLNWLCLFDLFDRTTGRWVWRLRKDERDALAQEKMSQKG
nr:DUF6677 family protein [uncultured Holophaga sp.]